MSTQLPLADESLPAYLRGLGIAGPGDRIRVERAGDGNINWVRRARLGRGRSVIVKQARSALERFPQYEVTTERIVFEARYLEHTRRWDEESLLPEVLAFDEQQRVLILEDVEPAMRLDRALAGRTDPRDALESVARFLGRVHRETMAEDEALAPTFANDAMRRLHGDHIFVLPYQEVFPTPHRTAARAEQLRTEGELAAIAHEAYRRYLEPRGALVHADVQPTNLLLTAQGPKLLDAEIAHVGDPAFDVGTLLAHLMLPAAARGHPTRALPLLRGVWSAYAAAHGETGLPSLPHVLRLAGLEMIRRTIGAARVELVTTDTNGLRVLEAGTVWAREPERAAALVQRPGAQSSPPSGGSAP